MGNDADGILMVGLVLKRLRMANSIRIKIKISLMRRLDNTGRTRERRAPVEKFGCHCLRDADVGDTIVESIV